MEQQQQLDTLYHCVFSLHYHLVLVTKYRKKCISGAMLARLEEIFQSLAARWQCRLLEFSGEADHVHMLWSLTPKVLPAVFVNNLKTVSSRIIRKEFAATLAKVYRKPVFWSRSYCLITCGGAPLSIIKQYIEQQQMPD